MAFAQTQATSSAAAGGQAQPHDAGPILGSTRLDPVITTAFPGPESMEFQRFPTSRRSVVYGTKGVVACTQPLAARAGIKILEKGGNAADAAVAVAAALNVTEPCSTGIGGDVFCLYYNAADGSIKGLNASGRSGKDMNYTEIRKRLGLDPDKPFGNIPMDSVHAVTVPGAPAGWFDTLELFGNKKLDMKEVLAPAIELADNGFPVSELSAYYWKKGESQLLSRSANGHEMLLLDPLTQKYRAPRAGEIMTNPNLAQTFRTIATEGKAGFYSGRIASSLLAAVNTKGSLLCAEDLSHHQATGSELTTAISHLFQTGPTGSPALRVWEHPPNSQGLVALLALAMLQHLQQHSRVPMFSAVDFLSVQYMHAVIETLRLAFKHGAPYVGDPASGSKLHNPQAAAALLDPRTNGPLLERWTRPFDPNRAISSFDPAEEEGEEGAGQPVLRSSDTVYFAVTDGDGNACSFINSNYAGFGSAIVPAGCGFTLQNRGANFSLDERRPDCVFPRRRPYHTLVPGLVTFEGADAGAGQGDGGEGGGEAAAKRGLHSVFGVMGGYMQPQGHMQVFLAQAIGGCNPQQALDAPRICIGPGTPDPKSKDRDGMKDTSYADATGGGVDWTVYVEKGMPEATIEGLRKMGHEIVVIDGHERSMFGRGQIIRRVVDERTGRSVWAAGSDGRGDGAAFPE